MNQKNNRFVCGRVLLCLNNDDNPESAIAGRFTLRMPGVQTSIMCVTGAIALPGMT